MISGGNDLGLWLTGGALGLLALALYAYIGYPALTRWFVRVRPSFPEPRTEPLPRVSILVAAHNEAGVILSRLKNLLEQDYPADRLEILVVSDASNDGTDDLVLGLFEPRIRFFRQSIREGKSSGINRIAPEAKGEILVHTDANVLFSRGAVRELVEAFRDPGVGVVLGEVRYTNWDEPGVASGEGLYWRFESWIKRVEAERGLLGVANGGIYALRRSLWQPLPSFVSGDCAEPLLAARAGFRSILAQGAQAFERSASTYSEEFKRKVRIIAHQVACARWIGIWTLPRRITWAYLSHKLMRYLVPLFWAGAFTLALGGWKAGSTAGGVLALLTLAPLILAPFGWIPWPGRLGRLLRLPAYFLMINVAALAGLWRGLRGGSQASWESPASTREAPGPGGPQPD